MIIIGRDLKGFRLDFQVPLGHVQPFLIGACFYIIDGHLGRQTDQGISVIFLAGLQAGLSGFDRPPYAAKQVDLPTRIESRGIEFSVGIEAYMLVEVVELVLALLRVDL